MILFVVLWLNVFPPVGVISQKYSPRTTMPDCTLYYSKNCRLEFGTYAETHEDVPTTNCISERSQVAIYLGPTTKFQGSCKFTSLRTWQRITRKKFTSLPMTPSVINQVEDMAIKEDRDEDLIFTHINGITL